MVKPELVEMYKSLCKRGRKKQRVMELMSEAIKTKEIFMDDKHIFNKETDSEMLAMDIVTFLQKWGTLRFYYGYKDAPCGIAAMDFIGSGISIRFDPDKDDKAADSTEGNKKRRLREDIAKIVRNAEERSKTTCEWCGDTKTASLRTDLGGRIVTLCDSCVGKFIERRKQRRKEIEEKRKEIFEKLKSNGEESD